MSALTYPAIITANGTYEQVVRHGYAYLFTLKGVFDGATVVLTTESNNTPNTYDAVIGGSWTAEAEEDLRAPSNRFRLTVTNAGALTSISVTFIQHRIWA